jgi:putative sugar O-methyltransferase
MLQQMLKDLENAPSIYSPSPFWRELNATHIAQLEQWGITQLKRTVNTKYFNWTILGIFAHQMMPVGLNWLTHPDFSIFSAPFPDYNVPSGKGITAFNPLEALIYKTYVGMLAGFTRQHDPEGYLKTIEEPTVGNPWRIRYNGNWISQDLCNSIYELYSALNFQKPTQGTFNIAELGAGYGRLAYVFLKVASQASYTIIDIPPALFVAQEYLSTLFPQERIFKYREFSSFDSVRDEFNASRIRFLMANQIELLPPKQFDLFINISSLHEMTQEQITNFTNQIDRTTKGNFYTKQWRKSRAGEANKFVLRENEYPIPKTWQELWHRQHPVQRMFFDALYEIK